MIVYFWERLSNDIETNSRSHSITYIYSIYIFSFCSRWFYFFDSSNKLGEVLNEFIFSKRKFSKNRVNISLFVSFEFKFTCFNFSNYSNQVFSYCTCFWVRHQSFWTENSCDFSELSHHWWSSYTDIKVKSLLAFCNFFYQFFSTHYKGTSIFYCFRICTFDESTDFNCSTSSMWKSDCSSNHLISIFWVKIQIEVYFNWWIKFYRVGFFKKLNCFIYSIESRRTYEFKSFSIFLSSMGHKINIKI